MAEELKPCPFCGGDPELDTLRGYRALHSGLMGNQIAVYCLGCTAEVSVCREDVPDITLEQVVEMWNLRTPPVALTIALENCRLFAARHRKEDWAATILRFCADGGATGSPLREAAPTVVEPDWDDIREQAEEATGLKVERHTYSIVIREVRKWLAATPPRAALTDEQLKQILMDQPGPITQGWFYNFARAVIAADRGEKQ